MRRNALSELSLKPIWHSRTHQNEYRRRLRKSRRVPGLPSQPETSSRQPNWLPCSPILSLKWVAAHRYMLNYLFANQRNPKIAVVDGARLSEKPIRLQVVGCLGVGHFCQ